MATHGFIGVKFEEQSHKDRTLIHAVHDGYVDDMILDILTIPFYIANTFKVDNLIQGDVPEFLKSDNRNKRKYIYEIFSTNKFVDFERVVREWSNIIPIDDSRYTFPSYLISKRPDKYQVVKEPFMLYGDEVDKADIEINFVNRRLNTLKITFNKLFDKDDELYHLDLIKEINNYLTEEKAKIKVLNDGNLIIMNIDYILIDLFYHKKI